jgi:hypothetical protein
MQVYEEEDEYPDMRPTLQRTTERTRVDEGEHYEDDEDQDMD